MVQTEYESGSEIDDVIRGMKYASLAITDDKPGTLQSVGKMNPWHVQALKIITGSEAEAHKPLTYLLKEHMQLECDSIIDVSGMTKGGHFLDTQGYIAHNDEVIVLAYRCTTTVFDWLTNLNTTSSEWEIDEDVAQGFSGYCSGLEGLCCNADAKPRVHTGFYNNFLCSVPAIREHIDPLLQPDQPPRRLYVVGHSLGAGIATLASCYFLMEYDWENMPHTMVSVTAGSPRTSLSAMRDAVNEELEKKAASVSMLRIVRNKDVVATVPPAILGFHHLGRLVFISEEGEITMDAEVSERDGDEDRIKLAAAKHQFVSSDSQDEDGNDGQSGYEKKVAKIPKAFRDHMPDFYLSPMKLYRKNLFPAVEEEQAVRASSPSVAEEEEKSAVKNTRKNSKKKLFSRFSRKKREKQAAVAAVE